MVNVYLHRKRRPHSLSETQMIRCVDVFWGVVPAFKQEPGAAKPSREESASASHKAADVRLFLSELAHLKVSVYGAWYGSHRQSKGQARDCRSLFHCRF